MTTPFLGCIADAEKAGEIDKDTAAQARATYEDAHAAASESLSPVEADRAAARAVMTDLEAKALREKQLSALNIRARRAALEGIAAFKRQRGYGKVEALGGKGAKPPKGGWVQGGEPPKKGPGSEGAQAARALELLVENKPGQSGAPFPSIDGRYRALRGQSDAMMADLIEAFETKTGFDAPGRARLDNVVREAFGEGTGDQAAKALASAWGQTAEHARLQFNAAGGAIGKREGWGMPQQHDALKIRAMGKAAWLDRVIPALDRNRMIDAVTKAPFTEKRLRAVLGDTWEKIATGGLSEREPGARLGRGALANQHGEARFMVFKSADHWLAYSRELGGGDPFSIMMGSLDELARDTAQMQILGPNPQEQFKWLASFAEREAAMELAAGVKGAERGKTYLRQATNMYDHYTGAANAPDREWLAKAGSSARSYLTGSMLGSAVISDVGTSPVFGVVARAFSGQKIAGDFGELVKLLASPEARAQARRMGFIQEQATDGLIHGTQENLRLLTVGGTDGGKGRFGLNAFARRLPAATFRLSGLTASTVARKRSFRLQMMGALADRAGQSLATLAKGDREDRAIVALLKARGFTEAEWGKIGEAERWEPAPGASFLRPQEIMASAGDEVGLRVAEMVEMETRMAVPETTLWTRAKLLGTTRPGTFQGELMRSWSMFRSFSLTASHLYGEELLIRALRSATPKTYLAAWAAGMISSLTVGGAVAIQLRQLAQGKDPRKMTDARFWGSAFLQGSGGGIAGDFLYSAQSRAGKSSTLTGLGPLAAAVSDTYDLTAGNATDIATRMAKKHEPLGQAVADARVGRDAVRYAGRYQPLASLWWSRSAFNRDVSDQLQKLVDPDAEQAFLDASRQMQRDYGQEAWWPNGEALPQRAPNLGAMLGPAN